MIGERLQELRLDAELSQSELAKELSVSFHTISSYERNRSEPNDEIKVKIAQLFNISLDYLLGVVNEPYSYQREQPGLEVPEEFRDQMSEFLEFLKYRRCLKAKDADKGRVEERA